MKEYIFTILDIILVFIGILIVISTTADFVGKATIYSDQEKTRQMEVCLSQGIDFKSCYHGIYNQYINFEGK